MPSPCIGDCRAKEGLCLGCGRTLTEIGQWSVMDSEAQLARMAEIDGSKSTHACPGCGEPAFCAVSAGEPIERCWCSQGARTMSRPAMISEGAALIWPA